MKKILLGLVIAMSLSTLSFAFANAPCVDNQITGKRLMSQFHAYEAVRDEVKAIQRGEETASAEKLDSLVQKEAGLAVMSWVRAEIYTYLGELRQQQDDTAGAVEAYQEALKWAKQSQDNDLEADTGAEFQSIDEKALADLK